MWILDFTNTAIKQMDKLTSKDKERIFDYLEKGNLKKFWRYRVGDYRIVVNILEDRLIIQVVQVGRRREIYQ